MPDEIFRLDLNEPFPQLAQAPIVEAIIHWQARAQAVIESDVFKKKLQASLPQFSKCESLQKFELLAEVSGQSVEQPNFRQQREWNGYRLTSADGRFIVQVLRDGVVFSGIKPYEGWDSFTTAAKQAWQAYRTLAEPGVIQRLGVRFINHLTNVTPETLKDFLRDPPTCPSNLPLKEFVYQSTFSVPETSFGVRLIKLMQSPNVPPSSTGLFLDCDVFTTHSIEREEEMEEALVKMRWLKNKFFFALLTPHAIATFQ